MRTARVCLRRWFCGALAIVYALAATAAATPAAAQGIPLVRDTEVENLLKDYSRPIFKAAGLGSHVTMRIVRHESFNAFVIDGLNVFMNTGTILQAKTPNEVIGVIAHEAGHITGGHMAALRTRIARDQTKALLLMVLGIGLMVGGATAGGDTAREIGGAGGGVMMGGQEVLLRSMLSERRAQESAADQAGLKFLETTRQSGRGMLETFEGFAQQEYVSAAHQDVFMRSHPVAADRIARLRDLVSKSPYANQKDPPALQLRHDMARAKISGYLEARQTVLNRYPASDNSLPARYARAIARNCSGKCDQAMAEVDALIKEKPDNPYFWEIKGSFYYWSGKHREAIPHLRKALQLAGGDESLIQHELAQALLATEDAALLDEAMTLLRRAVLIDPTHAPSHHQLATAFYRKGQHPQADLAAAQGHFAEGNVKQAQTFAGRALAKLPRGSPEWIRAEDITKYKAPPT
ncbi:MAG: M48 family metalloprotease [Hyphomonadaceae bacterium]|nr:M48 family metalloprotease [Hyphomonadaceae bacterium]